MNSNLDRHHLLAALTYAALGLGMGIYMAASHDHGQAVAHAHLLLVGFLMSFVYAVIGRLWLPERPGLLRMLQFSGHHLGVIGLVVGLLLLYGGSLSRGLLEPVLASASILVLLSLALMAALVFQSGKVRPTVPGSGAVYPNEIYSESRVAEIDAENRAEEKLKTRVERAIARKQRM